MRPDPDYIKRLLSAFQDAPGPTTDIKELEQQALPYEEPVFDFHLRCKDETFKQLLARLDTAIASATIDDVYVDEVNVPRS
jgi:hypothetical protein